MKVIQEGEAKQVRCEHCKALLEFEPNDVQLINTAVGYAGETFEPEFVVDCGSCGENVNVSEVIGSKFKSRLIGEYRARVKV